jgi:hypothetical protein
VTALALETAAPGVTAGRTQGGGVTKRLFEPSEVTLEDLEAHGRAECPVCHGELERGGCATCGSSLS